MTELRVVWQPMGITPSVCASVRQEALLAAISEKDANIALLELSSSKKKKTQDEVALLKREKDRLVHQLKQQFCLAVQGQAKEQVLVELNQDTLGTRSQSMEMQTGYRCLAADLTSTRPRQSRCPRMASGNCGHRDGPRCQFSKGLRACCSQQSRGFGHPSEE
ncbi:ERC protein 2 [Anabarilius grahami]|uniref:ERC protein 2 n=1 Tax=Anabarilius grahami TaxID=495550 RepID=A0A3N0Z2T1_ANAGA|nr:ERC protein 2 [Anabarilius grahami]